VSVSVSGCVFVNHLVTGHITCCGNVAPNVFSFAGYLQDLHVYDPTIGAWTDLSAPASSTPPPARFDHGFTSAGGKLYVLGGADFSCKYLAVLGHNEFLKENL
jgi:hypothetical protein